MYKKKFQSMVTGPIGCVGLHVLVPVEAEWKHVHVCVRIRRHRRVEKIVWEVHMKCSSALRLYVLVSITCTSFKYYFFLTFWSLVIFYKNKTWLKPLCIMIEVDGNWGDWSSWSQCSASCGGGNEVRSRNCSNPAPSHGGKPCAGDPTQSQTCANTTCPGNLIPCFPELKIFHFDFFQQFERVINLTSDKYKYISVYVLNCSVYYVFGILSPLCQRNHCSVKYKVCIQSKYFVFYLMFQD